MVQYLIEFKERRRASNLNFDLPISILEGSNFYFFKFRKYYKLIYFTANPTTSCFAEPLAQERLYVYREPRKLICVSSSIENEALIG